MNEYWILSNSFYTFIDMIIWLSPLVRSLIFTPFFFSNIWVAFHKLLFCIVIIIQYKTFSMFFCDLILIRWVIYRQFPYYSGNRDFPIFVTCVLSWWWKCPFYTWSYSLAWSLSGLILIKPCQLSHANTFYALYLKWVSCEST